MKFIASACLMWLLLMGAAASGPELLEPHKVAEGVYAFIGALEDVSAANGGNVINSGFIIGDDGVIVIDTGVNFRHGEKIHAAIKSKTDKPVVLVLNTHPHPENVLGDSVFSKLGVRVAATPATVQAMKQRCEVCYKHVNGILGEAAMAGTEIVIPEQLDERATLRQQAIEVGGRKVRLLHYGWGHTEGDLAVLDVKTGVLFAGGLVSLDRIPVMMQAKVKPWIAALEQLRKLPIKILVPGHGPVARPKRINDTLNYLRDLLKSIEKQYRAGDSVFDALRHTEMPAYRNWALYPATHLLNVQHVYSELERAEFQGSVK
ncbi:MAG: MBL fold metallo-hydrolase [Burkholderiales bacterium]|nr:MBL fold metallo-hydrolase [Burkholderiales bacterium]